MDPADGEIQQEHVGSTVQPILHSFHLGDVALGWSTQFSLTWCLDLKRTKKKELHREILCGYLRLLACLKLAYRDIYIYSWALLQVLITRSSSAKSNKDPIPQSSKIWEKIWLHCHGSNDHQRPTKAASRGYEGPPISSRVRCVAGQKCSVGLGA